MAQVYDTTYGIIKPTDTLVVLDDSIVRGTTLRTSILRILDRLGMKKIVIVSSAPQIRFPDCYGIDMSKMKDFVAFEAAVALIRETGRESMLDEIYEACRADPVSQLARTYGFLGLEPFEPDSDALAAEVNPTTRRKFEPSGSLRASLLEGYAPDLAQLRELAPGLDLSLWPSAREVGLAEGP